MSTPEPQSEVPSGASSTTVDVVRFHDLQTEAIVSLLAAYGLEVSRVPDKRDIPGSHWGDDEAGLIGSVLYARADTPVHSIFHEACHWILMDADRRARLHTDAGGSQTEENAVCYLQILLAAHVPGYSRELMCRDMDRWGYSFRLGSARAWFDSDADDAIAFLLDRNQISGSASDSESISVCLPAGYEPKCESHKTLS